MSSFMGVGISQIGLIRPDLGYRFHFLLSAGSDMNVLSQMSFLKIFQNLQKWFINASEEPNPRNVTLNSGMNLKQILICYQFVICLCSY